MGRVSTSVIVTALTLVAALPAVAAPKSVTLPFSFSDGSGNQFQVYANGMMNQNGGNPPVFSQVGSLTINNTGMSMNRGAGQARYDDKTNEVTIENLTLGGLSVTRRITLSKEDGTIRYVDTFRNPGNKELSVNVQLSMNINFGIQTSRTLMDARKKDQLIGWAGMTHGNRAVYLMFAAPNAKLAPRLNYNEGNNIVQAIYSLTIPPGKETSIIHYHGSADTLDRAADLLTAVKPAKLLDGVPPEVRRTIVNGPVRNTLGTDIEILRGDTFDILETRNGDQLRGTLKDTTYPLETPFGKLELPAEKVIAIACLGKQKAIQLLVTNEGEVFGGMPQRDFVTFQLSSGQTIKVPISQISRAGYRKQANEPEDVQLTKPQANLRTGERVAIEAPKGNIDIASRFGLLSIPASSISSVLLKNEEAPVHAVTLTDGSTFSGLLTAAKFDFILDGAAGKVPFYVPTAAMASLRPTPVAPEATGPELAKPELKCAGDDSLVGTLAGGFTLDTAFEAVQINPDQVRRIARAKASEDSLTTELQVTLWDQTTLTGQCRTPTLPLKLVSGLVLNIPVDLLDSYENPFPKPSDDMAARIKELVAKLNDDDFKVRETAQKGLLDAGNGILPLLKELREAQPPPPPEALQRIDQIIQQLSK